MSFARWRDFLRKPLQGIISLATDFTDAIKSNFRKAKAFTLEISIFSSSWSWFLKINCRLWSWNAHSSNFHQHFDFEESFEGLVMTLEKQSWKVQSRSTRTRIDIDWWLILNQVYDIDILRLVFGNAGRKITSACLLTKNGSNCSFTKGTFLNITATKDDVCEVAS